MKFESELSLTVAVIALLLPFTDMIGAGLPNFFPSEMRQVHCMEKGSYFPELTVPSAVVIRGDRVYMRRYKNKRRGMMIPPGCYTIIEEKDLK